MAIATDANKATTRVNRPDLAAFDAPLVDEGCVVLEEALQLVTVAVVVFVVVPDCVIVSVFVTSTLLINVVVTTWPAAVEFVCSFGHVGTGLGGSRSITELEYSAVLLTPCWAPST